MALGRWVFIMVNDADGVVGGDPKRGFRPPMEGAGFNYNQPPLFQPGTTDFTAQISTFKKQGAEILTGIATPPDFSTFWIQAAQQGLTKQLKAATIAKALLFPPAIEALGEHGDGLVRSEFHEPMFGKPLVNIFKDYFTETCIGT